MKVNAALASLTLDSDIIGDYGAFVIGKALKRNSALTLLTLNNNAIECMWSRIA